MVACCTLAALPSNDQAALIIPTPPCACSVFNANPLLLRDLGELTYGVQQIQRAAPQLEDGQVLELATNPAALFKVVHRKPQAQPTPAPVGQQQPG